MERIWAKNAWKEADVPCARVGGLFCASAREEGDGLDLLTCQAREGMGRKLGGDEEIQDSLLPYFHTFGFRVVAYQLPI